MQFLRFGVWIGLAALVAAAAMAYPHLPPVIPRNIDIDGRAAALVSRSPIDWGLPVFLGVVTALAVEVLRAKLPARPDLFNFSGKEQLLRLPAEYRGEAIVLMQQFMDFTNLQLVLTFALVQWMLWRGAHGHDSQALTITLLVLPVLLLVGMGLFLERIQRAVDAAQRRYDSRRNPLRS